ncbi:hypothetical protein ACFPIB_16995 [Adhaeribacter terreus]|uniref:Uncharacterized protein n=1 Tax=Adhaeribacter terreus TaxID=529703 RepID=A0ABW0EIN5_9BACT
MKDYIIKVKETPEYNSVRSAAKDTVSNWISRDVKFFGHLDTDAMWKIDSAVFFNEDRSKALLLLLEIDKKSEVVFDYVKVLAAEYKEGNWQIYSQGFPTIGFDRSLNPATSVRRQYTYKQLSEISREELINGGYFDWRSCSINYDYVNDWFKEPLAEYHQEFLKRRSEN